MKHFLCAALLAFVCLGASTAQAQTSAFTYQGNLTDGVTPANGTYQMQFALFDAVSGGTQQGSTITNNSVSIVNGVFTVQLDFTSAPYVAGANRWLELSVKKPAEGSFTTLSPREQLVASPYSIRTLSTGTSDSLSAACVLCVNDAKIASISSSKVTGAVTAATNATAATTAGNVTGLVALANGGTGSNTQNFVDRTTTQTVAGNKTFSGNVGVSGTLAALLGQSVSAVYGTGSLTAATANSFVLVPGLTQTLTVPAGYSAYMLSEGGLVTTSTATNGYSLVDVVLMVDGAIVPNGGYNRIAAANTTGVIGISNRWSMSLRVPLSAGSHTFAVQATFNAGTAAATVSGNNTSPLRGSLVVVLFKN